MGIGQNLENKRSLLKEMERAQSRLFQMPAMDTIFREKMDAKIRLDSIKTRYGNDMEKWPLAIQSDHATFTQTFNQAEAKIEAWKVEKAKLDAERASIQNELEAMEPRVSLDELLSLQSALQKCSQHVDSLGAIIAEQESLVASGRAGAVHALAQLTKEKEDLLAAVACGETGKQKRLDAVCRAITEEEGRVSEHVKELEVLEQTSAGVRRKLEQAQFEQTRAERNYLDGLAIFLEQEMENHGAEYVKAAGELAEAFSGVIAIATIMEKCGAPKAVLGTYSRRFEIPSFLLDSCSVRALPDKPGVLYRWNAGSIQEKIESETERLEELGISIPKGVVAPI